MIPPAPRSSRGTIRDTGIFAGGPAVAPPGTVPDAGTRELNG